MLVAKCPSIRSGAPVASGWQAPFPKVPPALGPRPCSPGTTSRGPAINSDGPVHPRARRSVLGGGADFALEVTLVTWRSSVSVTVSARAGADSSPGPSLGNILQPTGSDRLSASQLSLNRCDLNQVTYNIRSKSSH